MDSKLKIVTCSKNNLTYPEEIYFSSPYKLTNYFRLPSGGIEYILMSSSPGIMSGDNYQMDIMLQDNSHLVISSQSYEKILKMDKGSASRQTTITLNHNSYLKYLPFPVIPFASSAFNSHTTINLADYTAKLIYADFISSGRHHNMEQFKYSYFISELDVLLENKLVYRENNRFIPKKFDLSSIGIFESFNCFANLLIYGFEFSQEKLSLINEMIGNNTKIEAAITRLPYDSGMLLKGMAHESDILYKFVNQIITVIEKD